MNPTAQRQQIIRRFVQVTRLLLEAKRRSANQQSTPSDPADSVQPTSSTDAQGVESHD
jgi:hypothetical protein